MLHYCLSNAPSFLFVLCSSFTQAPFPDVNGTPITSLENTSSTHSFCRKIWTEETTWETYAYWETNIKMHLEWTGYQGINCIHLTQNRYKQRTLVAMVTNTRVPQKRVLSSPAKWLSASPEGLRSITFNKNNNNKDDDDKNINKIRQLFASNPYFTGVSASCTHKQIKVSKRSYIQTFSTKVMTAGWQIHLPTEIV
jgi:hypothetical protein